MIRILRAFGWLFSGLIIFALTSAVMAIQLGWRFNVIPTGSMAPTFNIGGMIISRPVPIENTRVGDPVLFHEPTTVKEALICHRVVEINEVNGELLLKTKGDANREPDSWEVTSNDLVGITVYYIPTIGKLAFKTQLHRTIFSVYGREISISFILLFFMGLFLIFGELNNVRRWLYHPCEMRRKEIAKKKRETKIRKRQERILKGFFGEV